MAMETCGNCGATLAPDAEWCGQCFAKVARAADTAVAPPATGASPSAQPDAPDAALTQVPPNRPGFENANQKEAATPINVEWSRWKGGPESFGPIGRIVSTVLLLIALAAGFPLSQGALLSFAGITIPWGGLLVMYGVVAGALGVWALSKIWKRARIK